MHVKAWEGCVQLESRLLESARSMSRYEIIVKSGLTIESKSAGEPCIFGARLNEARFYVDACLPGRNSEQSFI